jgi:dihydroxy-acid dehydratase
VSPEAALGGPLGLVRDGDLITIDLDARRLDIALTDAELRARRADWQPPKPAHDTGWLQQYRRNVGPLSQGAVLVRAERPEHAG